MNFKWLKEQFTIGNLLVAVVMVVGFVYTTRYGISGNADDIATNRELIKTVSKRLETHMAASGEDLKAMDSYLEQEYVKLDQLNQLKEFLRSEMKGLQQSQKSNFDRLYDQVNRINNRIDNLQDNR